MMLARLARRWDTIEFGSHTMVAMPVAYG